jgi:DNA-binding MarR family transcriptional regulator
MNKNEKLTELIKILNEGLQECSIDIAKEWGVYEMQIKQFHYLKIIDKTPNITSSALAEILNITKPSVTEIINKLQNIDCVYREQCSSDKRVFYIKLTEKGENIIKLKAVAAEKFVKEKFNLFTEEEMNIFIKLMNKLLK